MGDNQIVMPRYAIGIGCTTGANLDDVLALVRATRCDADGSTLLASLDRRASIARAVAQALGLDLALFPAERLRLVRGIETFSHRAATTVGTASVAEASALAALGASARLVVPRRTGNRCTCAIAELV